MAGNDLVKSVLRSLEVLQVVSEAPAGIKLNDLAEELSLGSSTVHNLLRTLASRGFVCKTRGGRYHLGAEIPRLAECYASRSTLKSREVVLQALFKKYPSGILTYSELVENKICVLLRCSPEATGRVESPVGRTFGLYSSATGLLFLAFLQENDLLTVYQHHPFFEEGEPLWKTSQALENFLDHSRSQSYTLLPFKEPMSLVRFAFPVLDSNKKFLGSIGVALKPNDLKGESAEKIGADILQSIREFSNKEIPIKESKK